jgi:hypothetical protein
MGQIYRLEAYCQLATVDRATPMLQLYLARISGSAKIRALSADALRPSSPSASA